VDLGADVPELIQMKLPDVLVLALEHRARESAAFTLITQNAQGTLRVTGTISSLKL
jgi:hypothetical protein